MRMKLRRWHGLGSRPGILLPETAYDIAVDALLLILVLELAAAGAAGPGQLAGLQMELVLGLGFGTTRTGPFGTVAIHDMVQAPPRLDLQRRITAS